MIAVKSSCELSLAARGTLDSGYSISGEERVRVRDRVGSIPGIIDVRQCRRPALEVDLIAFHGRRRPQRTEPPRSRGLQFVRLVSRRFISKGATMRR